MSPAHETQSMREIRLLRGRLPRKGGGLTGMGKDNNMVFAIFLSNPRIIVNKGCLFNLNNKIASQRGIQIFLNSSLFLHHISHFS